MNVDDVRIGQLVRSRSGRDSGRWFVVVRKDGRYLLIADGNMRKVCQPKRKNVKHLEFSSSVLEQIASDLAAGKPVLDSELRKSIAEWEVGVESTKFESQPETRGG